MKSTLKDLNNGSLPHWQLVNKYMVWVTIFTEKYVYIYVWECSFKGDKLILIWQSKAMIIIIKHDNSLLRNDHIRHYNSTVSPFLSERHRERGNRRQADEKEKIRNISTKCAEVFIRYLTFGRAVWWTPREYALSTKL